MRWALNTHRDIFKPPHNDRWRCQRRNRARRNRDSRNDNETWKKITNFKNVRKKNETNNFSDAFKIWIKYLHWCGEREHSAPMLPSDSAIYFINNLILGYLFARARASQAMENVNGQRHPRIQVVVAGLAIAWIGTWQCVCAQRAWITANHKQFSCLAYSLTLSVSRPRFKQGAGTSKAIPLTDISPSWVQFSRLIWLTELFCPKNSGNILEYGKSWQPQRERSWIIRLATLGS